MAEAARAPWKLEAAGQLAETAATRMSEAADELVLRPAAAADERARQICDLIDIIENYNPPTPGTDPEK
jgi:hypothetical protein